MFWIALILIVLILVFLITRLRRNRRINWRGDSYLDSDSISTMNTLSTDPSINNFYDSNALSSGDSFEGGGGDFGGGGASGDFGGDSGGGDGGGGGD
jgi:uncharacterized membrane protein YgcG